MEIRERSQIEDRYKWKLEDLYQNNALWEEDFALAKAEIEQLAAYEGKLEETTDKLKEALDRQADTSLRVEKLFVYAMMHRDENNADGQYQALADRAMSLAVLLDAKTSFFVPEILSIDEEKLNAWRKEDALKLYDQMLENIQRAKPHTLSASEEKLLAMSGEIGAAPQNIYKMLDYADLHFPKIKGKDGEIQLTHGNYTHLMENLSREIRKETFEAYYDTYEQFQNSFAAMLAASNKNDVFQSSVRHYPNAMEASLFGDKVPRLVYDQLIAVVRKNLPQLHRYIALKKKVLKIDEMHMYDLYVPLSEKDMAVSYEDAKKMVLDGLKPLEEDYRAVLSAAFDDRWIDVYENKGKSSGAYSWGCYGTHPYVLMNYQENIDSVFTLAHEMGHAMHSYYSDQNQPYVKAQYPILLAEVASTVNESLLIEDLMEKETDREMELRLLNYYLEQFRGTIFRQVMFAEFEKWTHEQVEAGEALTADSLKDKYMELNQDYYGSDIIVDERIAVEWARISHFYNAFYVYKYATGFASAIAISKALREEGEEARLRYMNFLSSGGSDYPLEILKRAGVNLEEKEALENAFAVFKESLDRLEKLL